MPSSRSVPSRFALVLLLAVALVTTLLVPAGAESPEERRLREAQARLDQVKSELATARAARNDSATALESAEEQLTTVMEALTAAELAVERQRQHVERAREELARLEDEEADQRRVMGERAAALYRQGMSSSIATVLSADSRAQVLQRSTYAEVLGRADRAAFEGVEIAQTATDAQRRTLEAEEAALERVAEQRRRIVAAVEELRDERALVLAGAEEALRDLEAEERYLAQESVELSALARRAGRQAAASRAAVSAGAAAEASAGAPAPQPGAGGWTWPAGGPVTSEYGRRWGRQHAGIDIGAPTGAPIVAARAGTVSFVGVMGGYGNLVLVDHGGGVVTAYAHMSSFGARVGQRVGAGQRIGSIGCTGSCTGPHLHFEVRVNGAAQNPRGYLG